MKQFKILTGGQMKSLGIDAFFDYLQTVEGKSDAAGAFKALAYVYRAVLLRSNALTEIPYRVLDGEREIEWPIPMTRLLFTAEADLCIYGAAYLLKANKRVSGLRRLNPSAMKVEADENGIKYFTFTAGAVKKDFNPKEIIYFHYYDPGQDLQPGISPTQVALEAANLGISANRFADAFFKHGAIPGIIFETEGTIDAAETERATSAWDQLFGGIANKFRTAILGGGTKAHVVGSPTKEVAMPELMGEVRKQVAVAFGIPEDLLTAGAANYATAESHAYSFVQHTVIPEARMMEEALNEQLFSDLGYTFEFDLMSLPAQTQEEFERAQALNMLVKSGLKLETALGILGFDIPEDADITPTATPLMVTGREPSEWKGDLKKWEAKCLRYLEETGGKNAMATFPTRHFPWQIELMLYYKLSGAKTADQVRAAFRSTMQVAVPTWISYWPAELQKEKEEISKRFYEKEAAE